jgi:hypothetical protein
MRPASNHSACIIFLCQRNNAHLRNEILRSIGIKNSAQLRRYILRERLFRARQKVKPHALLPFCAHRCCLSCDSTIFATARNDCRVYFLNGRALISTLAVDEIARLRECLRIAMERPAFVKREPWVKYDAPRRISLYTTDVHGHLRYEVNEGMQVSRPERAGPAGSRRGTTAPAFPGNPVNAHEGRRRGYERRAVRCPSADFNPPAPTSPRSRDTTSRVHTAS